MGVVITPSANNLMLVDNHLIANYLANYLANNIIEYQLMDIHVATKDFEQRNFEG